MKILNVNMSVDPITGGGTAERTIQMSRFLSRREIECTILTTDVGTTPELVNNLEGAKLVALPILYKRFYVPQLTAYRQIRKVVAEADVVHLMCHWTLINTLAYLAAIKLNKPYVVCPAGALPIYGRSWIIKKIYNCFIGKRIIRNASGHIAIAVNEMNQYQAYGVATGKISIIPNGINAENFQINDTAGFRKKYGLSNAPFIMFMGRLNYIKGPDLLLRAFCNLKDKLQSFQLVFVGPDGGMLAELKDLVAEFQLNGRVHFPGYLGGDEKSKAYHAADLLVIPSRQEAMSIVVLEAGIAGTPVLLTDQCGFNEVSDIGGGRVVPATVDGLGRGLIKMLSDPPELKEMGVNLKGYIESHYTWETIIKKYLDLYSQILN